MYNNSIFKKLCGILWTFYSPKSLPIRINDCLIILRFSINQKTIVVKYCQLNFILSFFSAQYYTMNFFMYFIQKYEIMYIHLTTQPKVQIIFLNYTQCTLDCKIQTQIHKMTFNVQEEPMPLFNLTDIFHTLCLAIPHFSISFYYKKLRTLQKGVKM